MHPEINFSSKVMKTLANQNDGLVILFLGGSHSQFIKNEMVRLEQHQNLFDDIGCSVFFVIDDGKIESDKVIVDDEKICYKLSPKLENMSDGCDSMVFLKKDGENFEHIYSRLKPSGKYNWVDEAINFCRNYHNDQSEDGKWKFGQIVSQSGEYLCTDCGYIVELSQGDIFPVCEVCLSGDPRGSRTIKEGFWQKLDA